MTPEGNHVIYGHLREHFVEVGQTISPGMKIGRFGNMGSVIPKPTSSLDFRSGLHLHFEIRQGSQAYSGKRLGYKRGW